MSRARCHCPVKAWNMSIFIYSSTGFFFAFIQVIEIEKLASLFYKIISQIQPGFEFIDSERNKGKSCVKYIISMT